ncbi:MAG: hypothetical protein ABS79_02290, partial [Planctomycetes bacterium SCN 63-9]
PWIVVGLLWVCGFLNYADRQAVTAVIPILEKKFELTPEQIGWVGSSFMIVYFLAAPFAGYLVDLMPRRHLISAGLAFWSLICAATALSRNFGELVFFRGAEGLGESFYFPASMSLLAAYHGAGTRSRAMSIHQTSVYVGQAGGVMLAGNLAERYGWPSPFWVLGIIGIVYAIGLAFVLREPQEKPHAEPIDPAEAAFTLPDHATEFEHPRAPFSPSAFMAKVKNVLENPAVVLLFLVFIGANFVAAGFMVWLVKFIDFTFKQRLTFSANISAIWSIASLFGALLGGVLADKAASRLGGRVLVQGLGLLIGAPFVLMAGWASSIPMLVVGLIGSGLCKGVYDSNIFASLYDVVRAEDRGFAAGLMNTVGWAGGALASVAIGYSARAYGLSAAFASMAGVYIVAGLLGLLTSVIVRSRAARQAPPA